MKKLLKAHIRTGTFASRSEFSSIAENYNKAFPMNLTKMVCTAGPASENKLGELRQSGMQVLRLNMSHAREYSRNEHLLRKLRGRSASYAIPIATEEEPLGVGNVCAVMLDTKGPEIRTGRVKGNMRARLLQGQKLTLVSDSSVEYSDTNAHLHCDYAALSSTLNPGARIMVDDGTIELKVQETNSQGVLCEVINDGLLGSNKSVNLPEYRIQLPILTHGDRADLAWGIAQGVDFIALSFVQDAQDVKTARRVVSNLTPISQRAPQLVAKVESQAALDNFDSILEASDAVLIARGDLGVEIPYARLFCEQKRIIDKCNEAGKPVIVATQMLDSMHANPRPTRAEVTDVGSAVIDGADAVMLSGETASGAYPVESATAMSTIVREADRMLAHHRRLRPVAHGKNEHIARAAVDMAEQTDTQAIVVVSTTDHAARALARFRPQVPIIAFVPNATYGRALALHRSVFPICVDLSGESETDRRHKAMRMLQTAGWANTEQLFLYLDNASSMINHDHPVLSLVHLHDSAK